MSTIRLSEAAEQYLVVRRAICSPSTYEQDKFVVRRFVAAIGDLQVRNLTAEHVERWFHSLLVEHTTRDGRTRPMISASTFNFYRARIKELTKHLLARGLTRADLLVHVRSLTGRSSARSASV